VALVKSGWTVEEVLEEYPELTREQVEETLAYYEGAQRRSGRRN
ncbi:MAG TPA: DUF433 domain-containing protein, partial [Candidatus Korarchaeota archaeon]|nr:DUF433 domain-containing protein [Candidatus Korarchaeota archaeon]